MLIGGGTIAGVETETTMWSFDLWDTLGAVAAGALLWTVYDRCDAWVTAFVIMAIVGTGALSFGGASDMGTSLVGGGDDVAAAIVAWVMGGLWAGVGAMVATKVPDLI
jgi:hypothetical protein